MGKSDSFFWVEEQTREVYIPAGLKRKARPKKLEFVGWGSRPLIEFLESIDVDTSKKISHYDLTDIVNKYVKDHNLHHPTKKKRIICDDNIILLFGRKTIAKNKIYEMLGTHLAENQEESEDDLLFSSEEEDNASERQKNAAFERKIHSKKKVLKAPRSCFAAIIPDNVKRIYLKRSLVQNLLKEPEVFERKILGSFVRIKTDPHDYLQKNSHMLVQVTGLKKASDSDDKNAEITLQVSNFMKDVNISMLSDENFSKEECEDLCRRIKDGLIKKPTLVELEEKVQVLHEDITNHWIVTELALLQKLIDQANEKGWRRELFEYLERRQLLQTPNEQKRLLCEVPEIIPEEIEAEVIPQEFPDNLNKVDGSPESTIKVAGESTMNEVGESTVNAVGESTLNRDLPTPCGDRESTLNGVVPTPCGVGESTLNGVLPGPCGVGESTLNGVLPTPCGVGELILSEGSDVLKFDGATNGNQSTWISFGANSVDSPHDVLFEEQKKEHPTEICFENNSKIDPVEVVQKNSQGVINMQVIDLSDDDENEDSSGDVQILDYDVGSFMWYYADPQGDVQGPFSAASLKRWSDADYFPPSFKVWRTGQSEKDAVLLRDILHHCYPINFLK
ncbi:uncharacterized protein At5g08430 isoform X2 [Mercurialis annua]|uniref:uncharacterized protein At5g08430 isoform X2 n=1 Tax=Mercurialis annua TaxID=3986 RepID=UPI00215E71BC|nr:uncharacterized protein At5g08430 isoform X2 [Mercurialis annua]